jgi:hypothetical protein
MGLFPLPKTLDETSHIQAESHWEKDGWKMKEASSFIVVPVLPFVDGGLMFARSQVPCLYEAAIDLEDFQL